jgi:hypothetical protein
MIVIGFVGDTVRLFENSGAREDEIDDINEELSENA